VLTAAEPSLVGTVNTKGTKTTILLKVSDGIELPLICSRMERVFFNLIANSLEAMPGWGAALRDRAVQHP